MYGHEAASLPSFHRMKESIELKFDRTPGGSEGRVGTESAGHFGNEEFPLLKNPLPQPPRRAHIRMEFDLAEDGQKEDFDVEISEEDDFDV